MTIVASHSREPIPESVFISYARADGNEFAHRLYDELIKQQIMPWIDILHIPAGGRWNVIIDQALEAVKVVLVVLTPHAIISKQVEAEWNRALDLKKHIIPLLVLDCDVPRVLSLLNYVDFRDSASFNEKMCYLFEQIKIILGEEKLEKQKIHNVSVRKYEKALYKRKKQGCPVVVGKRMSSTIEYFQNRKKQIHTLASMVAGVETGIVSVVGRAGQGKTALVSKFLYDLERNIWPDGVAGRPIAGILYLSQRDKGITLENIFFGCIEMLDDEEKKKILTTLWANTNISIDHKILSLIKHFEEKTYIIYLDNMEDLLDAKGNIQDIEVQAFIQMVMAEYCNIRLILTTREPITFPKTDAPLNHYLPLDEGLDIPDGVQMMRQTDPGNFYGLGNAPDEKLAEIVKMVHGHPRALEVFAGIVRDKPTDTFDKIMELFFQHPMTAKELVDEGYRRLDENARRILEGLAAFGKPVPISALTFVLEPFMPGIDIEDIVIHLIRIHMIKVTDKQKGIIALHPSDQDFAYSQIPRAQ